MKKNLFFLIVFLGLLAGFLILPSSGEAEDCVPGWRCDSWRPETDTEDCGVPLLQVRICSGCDPPPVPPPVVQTVGGTRCPAGQTCTAGACVGAAIPTLGVSPIVSPRSGPSPFSAPVSFSIGGTATGNWTASLFCDAGSVSNISGNTNIGTFVTPCTFTALGDHRIEVAVTRQGITEFGTAMVTVTAGAIPAISLSRSSINFDSTNVGSVNTQVGTVSNTGGGTLNGSITGVGDPFLCLDGCAYSIPAGGVSSFTLQFAPVYSGVFEGTASFSGGGGASISLIGMGRVESPPPPPPPPPGGDGDGLCPVRGVCLPNPLKAKNIGELIGAVINFAFFIALAIAPLMVVIAGFFLVTSAGDPKRFQTAKDIILYTFVGALIVFLAKGLISAISGAL